MEKLKKAIEMRRNRQKKEQELAEDARLYPPKQLKRK